MYGHRDVSQRTPGAELNYTVTDEAPYFTGSGVKDRTSLSPEMRTVATVLLSVVIVFTSGGNLLTIIVMRVDRRLRSKPVSCMYIASLAGADLLVGAVVMTIMMLYTVTYDGRWVFGSTLCTIWTCVDYVSCTASLTNVWLIAVDRYRSVSQPLKAIRRRSQRRAAWGVLGAWLLPTVFWVAVICAVKARQSAVRDDVFWSSGVRLDNDTTTYSAGHSAYQLLHRQLSNISHTPLQTTRPMTNTSHTAIHFAFDAISDESTFKCDTDWQPPEVIIVSVIIMFYVPLAAIFVLFGLIMCALHRHMVAFTGHIRNATLSFVADQSSSSEQATSGLNVVTAQSVVHIATNSSSLLTTYVSNPPRAVATSALNGGREQGRPMSSGSSFKPEVVVADIVDCSLVVRVASTSGSGSVITTTRNGMSCSSNYHIDNSDTMRSRSALINDPSVLNRRRRMESVDNMIQTLTPSKGIDDMIELTVMCRTPPTSHRGSTPGRLTARQDVRLSDAGSKGSSSSATVALTTGSGRDAIGEKTPRCRQYASELRARRQDVMHETRLRRQVKAARTLGAITGVLLVCWLPFTVMVAMRAFCPHCLNQRTFDIASWINYINSAANPVIYGLCNSEYRLAIRNLLRRIAGLVCCCCGESCRSLSHRSNRFNDGR